MQTTTDNFPATAQQTEFDELMLRRAIALAAEGIGRVSPGPLVGCVIVDRAGAVVGEGFYLFEDIKHAETIALAQAADRAKGGTAYVSLEPHAHHGRTPPCTESLIAAGIARVVAPIEDPNPKVSGSGFEHLRAAGIDVTTGLLTDEATRVNEKYLHFMRTELPFVHLKLAVSLDGKIATRTGHSRWIAGPESLARAQSLRHEYDAILVGAGTALIDDPLLTDRSGLPRRRPFVRVVMDDRLDLSLDSKLVSTADQAPVLIVANQDVDTEKVKQFTSRGVEVLSISKDRNPRTLLEELTRRSLQSVLVEGGSKVAGQFVDACLVNKATFFVAPKIIGGIAAPSAIGGVGVATMVDAFTLSDIEVTRRGDDVEVTGYLPGQ